MPTTDSRNVPNNTTSNSTEKPVDGAWITSGKFGSRDAVLVFRTNILNSRSGLQFPDKVPPLSMPAEASSLSKEIVDTKEFGLYDCHRSSSLNSILNFTTPKASTSSKTNNTFSSTRARSGTRGEVNIPSKATPSINLARRHVHMAAQKICASGKKLVSRKSIPIKAINVSLSSSDNSMSSEWDELNEVNENLDQSKLQPEDDGVGVGEDDEAAEMKINYDSVGVDDSVDDHAGENDEGEDNQEKLSEDSLDCAHTSNMPALKLNITYKFIQTETKLLRKIFVRHGLSEVDEYTNFNIMWTGTHVKPDILRNLAPYQRVNHFPRSYELTRKDRLYKNIQRMQHLRGFKHFDFVPQSFVLPLEYKDLVSAHKKHRGPWIVKPAASSRGRGIFIVNTVKVRCPLQPDQIPQDEQVLVSKYVADPLCIDGHKCDLRVYVLVTSFDPLIIYIFEEGLVRLATVKYDRNADNLWNPCMHLCNYSINKYHSDYIKSSDAHDEDVGHKWTLSALLRHLKMQGGDISQLMANIEDMIIKSILACAQSIISACRMFVPSGNNCFELYGFDILIDDTLKPWLLEINLSPSMGVDSPLDAKVKASLITDVLTCIGIPAYSPALRTDYDSKWTRFKNVSYTRRTNSADRSGSINNNNINTGQRRPVGGGASKGSSLVMLPPLTLEEQRIIRNARLQNARRGGFVRIFPTDDTMQRYGTFLDITTGIPLSTPLAQCQVSYTMIVPHNYNQILFNNLYGKDSKDHGLKEENSQQDRMNQYERALEAATPIVFGKKPIETKCLEEGKRLRKQIFKLIDNGSELTQLQARQAFALYLEAILRRLSQEPRDYHEKLILKFLNRVGGAVKAPVFFRNPQNIRVVSKARSAMVAKLLGDFLEQYNRDTEAYVDSFDHFGMIPTSLFGEFLSHAMESDLESVLALHTNLTGAMSYLYNRCGLSVPPTPPIPSGVHGFLKALPAMVLGGSGARDFNKYDGYFRNSEKDLAALRKKYLADADTTSTKKNRTVVQR